MKQRVMRRAVIAIAAAAAMVIAGCSSATDGSVSSAAEGSTGASSAESSTETSAASSDPSSDGAASESDSAASSEAGSDDLLGTLRAELDKAESKPDFAEYAKLYGAPIANPDVLKGKKLMIIPGTSKIASCVEQADAAKALAEAAGIETTIFANQGEAAERIQAVTQAINENYDAIIMECSFDPKVSSTAITQAAEAGIAVIVYGATREEAESGDLDVKAWVFDTFEQNGKLAADAAYVDHNGEPFHALAVTSDQVPVGRVMSQAMRDELAKICPDCTLDEVDVPVRRWADDTQSTVTSALVGRDDITVLFPTYDGTSAYYLAALDTLNRTGDVKAYGNFGSGAGFRQGQLAKPGSDVFQFGVGGLTSWKGYLMTLQVARVLAGEEPIALDNAIAPNRVTTPANVAEVLSDGGYGVDWVNGFRELVGAAPLDGDALFNAATLDGKLAAK